MLAERHLNPDMGSGSSGLDVTAAGLAQVGARDRKPCHGRDPRLATRSSDLPERVPVDVYHDCERALRA